MKRRMSSADFELAWRLRPDSWVCGKLDNGICKEKVRAVLVDGKSMKDVFDVPDWHSNEPFHQDWVGRQKLTDCVRNTFEQIFARIG